MRTAAWAEARLGARVVVGGRSAVLAPVPDLAAVVVLDDGDEALQEERAPTWHARDVGAERAVASARRLTLVSPVPTLESLKLAEPLAPIAPSPAQAREGWPVLDVVDLRDEPPGVGLLSEAFAAALHRTLDRGGRAVVRGEPARAARGSSRAARVTSSPAARSATPRSRSPSRRWSCPRCAAARPPVCLACHGSTFRTVRPGVTKLRDEIGALVPRVDVVEVDAKTERVPAVPVLVGHRGRAPPRAGGQPARPARRVPRAATRSCSRRGCAAAEQALWLLARAARLVGGRRGGGRVLVQTRVPDHEVLVAAATGDVAPLLDAEAARRRALGFPPFGGLAELSGDETAVAAACAALRDVDVTGDRPGLQVLGPSGGRALVQAPSAGALADALAAADLASARALGRLRVAVDPPRV